MQRIKKLMLVRDLTLVVGQPFISLMELFGTRKMSCLTEVLAQYGGGAGAKAWDSLPSELPVQ